MSNAFLPALVLVLVSGLVSAQSAPPAPVRDEALFAAATAAKPATIETLKNLVNIETGSANAEGMAKMSNFLEGQLKGMGASVTRSKAAANNVSQPVGENIYGTIKGIIDISGIIILIVVIILYSVTICCSISIC